MIKLLALALTAVSLAVATPAFAESSSTVTSSAPAATSIIYGYNPISRCYYALPPGQPPVDTDSNWCVAESANADAPCPSRPPARGRFHQKGSRPPVQTNEPRPNSPLGELCPTSNTRA